MCVYSFLTNFNFKLLNSACVDVDCNEVIPRVRTLNEYSFDKDVAQSLVGFIKVSIGMVEVH